MFDIVRQDPAGAHPPLEGWIQRDLAEQIFRRIRPRLRPGEGAGAARATSSRSRSRRRSASSGHGARSATINSHNVVGYLPGKKYPDETVIYSRALGPSRHRQARRSAATRIYNGALDNATGIAQLIEQARAFAPRAADRPLDRLPRRHRRGEGAARLRILCAANPLFPAAKTAGVINTDGGRSTGPAKNFTISGNAKLGLLDMLIAEGKKQGRYYSPDPHPEAGHFYRSDHFSFAKVGVPAISFGDGNDLVNGGVARGEALAKEYIDKHYHQPSDEWLADLGLHRHGRGREPAPQPRPRPRQFTRLARTGRADSEFRATRDATAAERPGAAPAAPAPKRGERG